MKKLLSLSLLLASLAANLPAQNLPKEVFDPAACGCASIDIDKVLEGDTAHINQINVNQDLLKATFVQYGNNIAQNVVTRLADPNAGVSLQTRINEFNKAIGAKKDGKKEEWIKDFNAIAAKATRNTDKVGLYMACQFAQNLHSYYLQYPEEAGRPDAQEFYRRQAALIPAPTPTPTPNPEEKPMAGGAPEANNPEHEPEGQTPWFWIAVGISASLAAAYLFASRPKDRTPELHQLREDLESTRNELLKTREKLAAKERETEQINRHNAELKAMVTHLEKERQQKISVNTNQQPISINTNSQNNQIPLAPLRRYLYAPSMDGSFASNSIKTQADSEAFYTLDMENENSHIAKFKLILEPAVVRRAEAMAQQYLLPACDIKGAGRIPQDLSQVQMTAGELVREGQGWRVTKKIALLW